MENRKEKGLFMPLLKDKYEYINCAQKVHSNTCMQALMYIRTHSLMRTNT